MSGTGITITTKIEAPAGAITLVDAGGAAGTGNLASSGTIEASEAVGVSGADMLTVIDTSIKYTVTTTAVASLEMAVVGMDGVTSRDG